MKIVKNTYPEYLNCPHGEIGDKVEWSLYRGSFHLVRVADGKSVFSTAPVNRDGNLRSNGKPPVLTGIIARVKSKGWILEIL
uniref:Uncharacterized protein n=1 Tax=viral metagenome TaxID=1070528 RepID=A0A6H1ZUU5_9ZZZZ